MRTHSICFSLSCIAPSSTSAPNRDEQKLRYMCQNRLSKSAFFVFQKDAFNKNKTILPLPDLIIERDEKSTENSLRKILSALLEVGVNCILVLKIRGALLNCSLPFNMVIFYNCRSVKTKRSQIIDPFKINKNVRDAYLEHHASWKWLNVILSGPLWLQVGGDRSA